MSETKNPLPPADEEYRLTPVGPAGVVSRAGDPAARYDPSQAERAGVDERLQAARDGLLRGDDPLERRFSLAGLFAITTFAAVVLAFASYVPPEIFAGVTGVATLASMIILALLRSAPLAVQLCWWMLLVIYLSAIGRAVLT